MTMEDLNMISRSIKYSKSLSILSIEEGFYNTSAEELLIQTNELAAAIFKCKSIISFISSKFYITNRKQPT